MYVYTLYICVYIYIYKLKAIERCVISTVTYKCEGK